MTVFISNTKKISYYDLFKYYSKSLSMSLKLSRISTGKNVTKNM